ncbi:hypothetical protein SAMN05216593_102238 [Pseudomonas asturiensis]|uniref:Short chain dehydrogenase n=1 Tax=Pseudomonas asturiensis TaxID=1190415 RepID=A0A1M7KLN0_9PSED|nr:hypothetical protein [Pseudomonas asturiensis]SHM66360.1 hypothetical protein SAMN05216593_102238 [Pseudomonas asturiensis]
MATHKPVALVTGASSGIGLAPAAAGERSIEQAKALFDTNFLGVVSLPYVALYAASKHAVEGYSESVDHEPGYTRTQFENNTLEADAKLDLYQDIRASVSRVVNHAMAHADIPDVVAQVVLKAACAERPKLRYTAGKSAGQLQFMRRFAPAGFLDAAIRKTLKLEAKPLLHGQPSRQTN